MHLAGLRHDLVYYAAVALAWGADWLWRHDNHLPGVCHHHGNRLHHGHDSLDALRVAIVTGGASGVGLEVARQLLACGAVGLVVVAARNATKASRAVEALNVDAGGHGRAEFLHLDLARMSSVERFARDFKRKYDRLDILVNNAGVLFGDYKITEDGFESQLAVNYMGHFYLTHLLMDRLTATGRPGKAARVVNVASAMHYGAHMFFGDFDMKQEYHPTAAYARSKMALILSARYLNSLFERRHLPVHVYSAHPGVVASPPFYASTPLAPLLAPLLKTTAQGAYTVTHCSLAPELENKGGGYFSNCREAYSDPYSSDERNQRRLFEVSKRRLRIGDFTRPDERSDNAIV